MSLSRLFSGLAFAAIALAGGLMSASSAKAEDLVDFLWGGSPEYGGGRSIVSFNPQYKAGQIIVSFSDRRLYLITKQGEAITYPVAIPTGEARWQGVTSVTSKRVNPPWTPTPDMVRANPRLPRWVPGGHPMNPLGIRAMYLGTSAYRIHGTDAPWTIGQAVSHGCIRLTNEDVLDLYPRVPVGTRVTVTWQQFQTHQIASGDSIPRFSDADSNPRAASATTRTSASSTASAETAPAPASSSSRSSPYSYSAYGAGKAATARTVSNQSSVGGGLESLFSSWDDQPKQSASASQDAEQNQASRDATRDDDDQAKDQKPSDHKKASQQTEPQPFEKAPKKAVEAEKAPKEKTAEAKPVAEHSTSKEASTAKKKIFSDSIPKKKATASASVPPSDPAISPALAVPDPIKPSSVSAPSKESHATPSATKASASAEEVLHVQQAAVQVQ
jgi:lipoprotein-anchoring transpeptidase ErfK/SrfK